MSSDHLPRDNRTACGVAVDNLDEASEPTPFWSFVAIDSEPKYGRRVLSYAHVVENVCLSLPSICTTVRIDERISILDTFYHYNYGLRRLCVNRMTHTHLA